MSVLLRWSGMLILGLLAVLTSQAQAQRTLYPPSPLASPQILPYPINPNQYIAPNLTYRQWAYNVGVLGKGLSQIPPWAAGYNPYPPAVVNVNPTVAATVPVADPYALSTVPSYNPYFGNAASLGSSPYSLSTVPSPTTGMYGGGGFFPGGWGVTPNSMGYGYALMGVADYTRAAGQYWKDIQSARMSREEVRQMQLETARRRIQFEAWYESVRPTAPKMLDAERATDLDRARKDPPDTEIVSGRALNLLLRSVQNSGKLSQGPNIPLDEDILKNINLSGGTSSGNVGMLKGLKVGTDLPWPEALQESGYDETRKRLSRNLRSAVDTIKDRDPLPSALRKDIQADFKAINDKLNESANDISPAQYIESRRFLNQLGASIRALADPKVTNYFNNTWNAKGKNIAEMVENMTKEGLTFAPAAPGEEAAYRAMYQALRAFEAGMQVAQR